MFFVFNFIWKIRFYRYKNITIAIAKIGLKIVLNLIEENGFDFMRFH